VGSVLALAAVEGLFLPEKHASGFQLHKCGKTMQSPQLQQNQRFTHKARDRKIMCHLQNSQRKSKTHGLGNEELTQGHPSWNILLASCSFGY